MTPLLAVAVCLAVLYLLGRLCEHHINAITAATDLDEDEQLDVWARERAAGTSSDSSASGPTSCPAGTEPSTAPPSSSSGISETGATTAPSERPGLAPIFEHHMWAA